MFKLILFTGLTSRGIKKISAKRHFLTVGPNIHQWHSTDAVRNLLISATIGSYSMNNVFTDTERSSLFYACSTPTHKNLFIGAVDFRFERDGLTATIPLFFSSKFENIKKILPTISNFDVCAINDRILSNRPFRVPENPDSYQDISSITLSTVNEAIPLYKRFRASYRASLKLDAINSNII